MNGGDFSGSGAYPDWALPPLDAVMTRRRFTAAAASLAALAVGGCATTAQLRPVARQSGCLPPVRVSANRLIRTMVGLRPYRASGFVVRAEDLSGKKLVHNYGHGGAGITLSWGTSRLAADLGLPGHQGPVAVFGAGIVGLTTARLVQEAGFPVTIYAKALPPDTVSNVAGGEWSPSWHYERGSVTPEWEQQFAAAAAYSYRRFQIMVGEDYGVRWLDKYSLSNRPIGGSDPMLASMRPETRDLATGEHPFPAAYVRRRSGMFIDTPRFLRKLLQDVQIAGGKVVVRGFATPAEIAVLPETLVFNCTGLGARDLFGDQELRPGRGQLAVLLPQPEIAYAVSDDIGYMFPHPEGIILGGTFELDNWSLDPDPQTTERILKHHQDLFSRFRCTA